MPFLVDTNVLSELNKPKADPMVVAWLEALPDHEMRVSVMVMAEFRKGIAKLARRDTEQADRLEVWLEGLQGRYRNQIVPLTLEAAEAFGEMSVPDALPCVDGLLAATAKVHGWTVVTRNVADFERTGVAILNPFEASASD